MSTPVIVKPRTRAGTWDTFERRYQPILSPGSSENYLRYRGDMPDDIEEHFVWSVLDCDGTLYVSPGYACVNWFAWIVCTNPWGDVEWTNPGYVY